MSFVVALEIENTLLLMRVISRQGGVKDGISAIHAPPAEALGSFPPQNLIPNE
jgi:hypothetical protein